MKRLLCCLLLLGIGCAKRAQTNVETKPTAPVAEAAAPGDENPWMSKPDPTRAPVPKWIWGPAEAKADEIQYFRVTFDPKVPPKFMAENPSQAMLWAACDDQASIYINGKTAIGDLPGGGGGSAAIVDVRSLLVPGVNVLTVKCKNTVGPAGIAIKLSVLGTYREPFYLVTDEKWKCSTTTVKGWRGKDYDESKMNATRVIGNYGIEPWGKLPVAPPISRATSPEQLTLLNGFKAELLYSVPKAREGSWVSMAADPKGRLYVSDQDGPLYRVTPGKDEQSTKVEQVVLDIGKAQGLLWALDSLFVTINGNYEDHPSGLYRVTDTNGDDKLDKIEQLIAFKDRSYTQMGWGEHGPHAVVLGPDGKLYVVAGNFTGLPQEVAPTSPASHGAEDLLLPREPDGKGHDPTIMAPGGWVCRIDPKTKAIETFCVGLRNTYDIAFSPNGELFAFDSDMEWDTGTHWYRPTRICHIVSGSEWGWRNGSGKWPTYYPDSLPPVVDIGLGSPTGLTFGTNAKFPERYQRALFANDWAYGKVFAVHMKPQGASYSATFETFISGKPFDVTDIVINPVDGAMYLMIGGRNTQSGLYRITYTGEDSTQTIAPPSEDSQIAEARALRHKLESFHGTRDAAAIDFAWPHLSSSDRFIRYAARVAVESQSLPLWQDRALKETDPTAAINAILALCRVGGKSQQPRVLEALDRLKLESLSREQKLELLRVYGLCFIRMGKPDAETLARCAKRFDEKFPTGDIDLDHELAQLLVYCDSPTIVAKSMTLQAAAKTQEEQLFHVLNLRHTKTGWTAERREAYFKWLNMAEEKYKGGASYPQFIQHIRDAAVATLSDKEKAQFASLVKKPDPPAPAPASTTPARKFVRNWQMPDLVPALARADRGRSFAAGKAAYEAASCNKCHLFNGAGGGLGPDITGAGSRFSTNDLLESILLPSKTISDQYRETKLVTKSHVFVGAVQSEDADRIVIRPSPLIPTTQSVLKKEITRRGFSTLSSMPQGLLNWHSEEEVLDLLAYIRAAGNPNDKAFQKDGAPVKTADASPAPKATTSPTPSTP